MSSQKEDLVVRAVLLKSEAFQKCKLDFSSSEFRFQILQINNNIQILFFFLLGVRAHRMRAIVVPHNLQLL